MTKRKGTRLLLHPVHLRSTVDSVSGRDVVLQLANQYFDEGYKIYCDRFFSYLDLAAYLRSRGTGKVVTSSIKRLTSDLEYLVTNMHLLNWHLNGSFSRLECSTSLRAVCLLVWNDKKYRTEDKKVVFIANCILAIPTSHDKPFHHKNIRDLELQYKRKPMPIPPILKAYNYHMVGVDKHDRMIRHLAIQLTSKATFPQENTKYLPSI
ncbi:hypothetical protein LOD99_5386 [Oopsacas minuta]|uniref:PiggyBac transposable element-derived protein domain-containing protein n=1 Tax=Oopsacas minuta TaxID=111878 RepID=A0AAV7JQU6_9METZ|nr:hypothetical protein LOD99_5386 [Oopsacas minuta]